ncbi:cytochrome c oxidase subunit 3, partial [Bacillus anthracis]|uniref:cytochrome c oxidase subunit 3 n=1 Tax=Bacillus anthracis TaxID=1392 RepID=UPI001E3D0F1D
LTINNFNNSKVTLVISITLGIYFISIQRYEYLNSNFRFNDSVFGNSFFILTGFHGLHVMIGLIFLITILTQLIKRKFRITSLYGFEYSI